jgi:hypothetical protein
MKHFSVFKIDLILITYTPTHVNFKVNMKVKDKVLVDPGAQELQLGNCRQELDNISLNTVNVYLLLL